MNEPMLLERLRNDHVRIGQVLTVLENQIRKLDDADGPDCDLLAIIVDYLGGYADAVHHPMEDQVFDHLVNKGITPSERKLVSVNLGQHVQIIILSQELARAIADGLDGSPISRDRIRKFAEEYLDVQTSHMEFEDQQMFPMLQRMFTSEDWSQLEKVHQSTQDPLFDSTLARYQDLYRHVVESDAYRACASDE